MANYQNDNITCAGRAFTLTSADLRSVPMQQAQLHFRSLAFAPLDYLSAVSSSLQ